MVLRNPGRTKVLSGFFFFVSYLILKWYISRDMKNKYTMRDCLGLNIAIKVAFSGDVSLNFYQNVIEKARIQTFNKEPTDEYVHELLKSWVSKESVRLFSTQKVIKFIFETDFEEIPLSINDNDLKMFVNWRFKIGK